MLLFKVLFQKICNYQYKINKNVFEQCTNSKCYFRVAFRSFMLLTSSEYFGENIRYQLQVTSVFAFSVLNATDRTNSRCIATQKTEYDKKGIVNVNFYHFYQISIKIFKKESIATPLRHDAISRVRFFLTGRRLFSLFNGKALLKISIIYLFLRLQFNLIFEIYLSRTDVVLLEHSSSCDGLSV